ncbi:MAG: DUF3313 domain-containing protein [Alphaproteobacteria bacterium]|nr:DUF3313 domain-containing protein [Alphaproteobacteria bacterium]
MQLFTKTIVTAVAIVFLESVAGCATQQAAKSGFLGDYSQLKPDPAFDGARRYQNPAKPLKQYRKFMLDPVVVHFAPNAEGTAISPDELKKLADYFHNRAVEELSKRYQVVQKPGPGVLRVRAAITDIEKTTPIMNIHPAMKMSGIGLGGASMEAEAIDSQTRERVIAVVDSRQGSRLSMAAGLQTYGHAKQVMDFWIERFVKQLDKAHGVK